MDAYTADEVASRLHELLAFNDPIAVTYAGQPPWVLIPADLFDTMLCAWAWSDWMIEQDRQALSPLPLLDDAHPPTGNPNPGPSL